MMGECFWWGREGRESFCDVAGSDVVCDAKEDLTCSTNRIAE